MSAELWTIAEAAWRAILTSGPTRARVDTLVEALSRAGLHDDAAALRRWSRHGSGALARWSTWPWNGALCTASPRPPAEAAPGDIWYDVVSLTPYVLLHQDADRPAHTHAWVSVRPARAWQARVFLRVAQWRTFSSDFIAVDDLMSAHRLEALDGKAAVTRVYHEEAAAYAHWFGAHLVTTPALRMARDRFQTAQLDGLFDTRLRLWDAAECPYSEFLRVARGVDTLDRRQGDEIGRLDREQSVPDEERVLFSEWEASDQTSFGTLIPVGSGLMTGPAPRRAFAFVALSTLAPRDRFPGGGV